MTESQTKRASELPGRGFLHVNKRKGAADTQKPHFLGKAQDPDGRAFSIAAWLHNDHDVAALQEAGIFGLSISIREWLDRPPGSEDQSGTEDAE